MRLSKVTRNGSVGYCRRREDSGEMKGEFFKSATKPNSCYAVSEMLKTETNSPEDERLWK